MPHVFLSLRCAGAVGAGGLAGVPVSRRGGVRSELVAFDFSFDEEEGDDVGLGDDHVAGVVGVRGAQGEFGRGGAWVDELDGAQRVGLAVGHDEVGFAPLDDVEVPDAFDGDDLAGAVLRDHRVADDGQVGGAVVEVLVVDEECGAFGRVLVGREQRAGGLDVFVVGDAAAFCVGCQAGAQDVAAAVEQPVGRDVGQGVDCGADGLDAEALAGLGELAHVDFRLAHAMGHFFDADFFLFQQVGEAFVDGLHGLNFLKGYN